MRFVNRILKLAQGRGGRVPVVPEVRGYQIVYDDVTRSQVDPDFEPLANDNAAKPDWFEYWPIRCFFAEASLDESVMYGFLSPKFGMKTGLTGAEVVSFVESVSDADVVLFSPFPDHGACFLNVFEQHQVFEPGFLEVCQRFFHSIGEDDELSRMVHHTQSVVFCNFFFAKPPFWRLWLQMCDQLFQAAEGGQLRGDLCEIFWYTSGNITKPVQRKVFLMERIASYLLSRPHQFRVASYPSSRMPMASDTGYLIDVFEEMNRLKRAFAQTRNLALLSRFRALQREVLPIVNPGVPLPALPVD